MSYFVKEIFYSLQGEGANAGRAAVFCRLAGCNLWSGREIDRATALCRFCDTDFVGTGGRAGGRYDTAEDLAGAIAGLWPARAVASDRPSSAAASDRPSSAVASDRPSSAATARSAPFVIFTGGEPLLQLDEPLVVEMHRRGFAVAIETNGTKPAPPGIDWICVSPKAGAPLVLRQGHELKLVFPQAGLPPACFEPAEPDRPLAPGLSRFEDLRFDLYFLQPMDGPEREQNIRLAVEYCLEHPQWRLSLQTHKMLGIQ